MSSESQGRTYRWLQRNDHDYVVVFSRFYILIIVIDSGRSLVIQYKSNVRDLALIDRHIVFRFLSDHCEMRKMSIRVSDEISRKDNGSL